MDAPAALVALAELVDARLVALDAALTELREERAVDPADDEHDPEGVTLSSEWSRIAGLRADAARDRLEVDAAFARVADGTYGVCIDCGASIPRARLQVRPLATRCVGCAERAGS